MKKRKTYEVSVINKTYSKTYSDQTKFYTSDTALELNFQLKEVEYDFDSAEIILLNVDDRSLATRPVVKSAEGFTYELEDDITARFGEWKGQLKFNEGGEIYVSSPVAFRIENDLNNDRPPQLTDIRDWETLRQSAKDLIAEMGEAVTNEAARVEAEKQREETVAQIENRQTSVENQFNALNQELTKKDVISAPEIIAARNGETNLKSRLDKEHQEVTAQLAQKASKVEVESKIGDLGAVATFKGSATNATILAKADMAVGDEWYDTTDQRSLRWNGSAWVDVGSTIKLGDESITTPKYAKKSLSPDKTTFIDELPTLNVFDKRGMTDGKRVYSANGTIGNLSGYSVNEDLRAIKPATTFTRLKNGELAFYDSDGVFISGVTSGTKTFTTPTNTASYRITCLTSDLDTQMMVEGTTLPTGYVPNYINKLNDSIQVGSVASGTLTDALWDCLGDSTTNTTYGKPYHQHIKDRTGIVPMNYGVNGTTIALRDGKTDSMLERYLTMDSNADIVTVMGGRNDISYAVPIGSMSDRVNNTVYGACHLLFSGLIEKFKGKKIGVILPLQRSTDTTTAINYIDAIREVAEYYSLPVLDLYRHSGLTPRVQSIVDTYMPDGLHPNSEGHEIISRVIEAWLRTL